MSYPLSPRAIARRDALRAYAAFLAEQSAAIMDDAAAPENSEEGAYADAEWLPLMVGVAAVYTGHQMKLLEQLILAGQGLPGAPTN
jgi:hypothetical protein